LDHAGSLASPDGAWVDPGGASVGGLREAVIYIFLGIAGCCVGSFLNVVAYRLPRECMSLARPRSRCPTCARPIAWFDNIPILSWVILGGRCRGCRSEISPRYPLVELATGILFVVTAALVLSRDAVAAPRDHGASWAVCGVALLVVSTLVALTLIDIDYRILPDRITKTGIVVAPLLGALAPGVQPGQVLALPEFGLLSGIRWQAFGNGVVGAVVAGGVLWGIGWLGTKAFRKEAMGFGDVKMIAAMGGLLGLWALLSLAVAAVAGALVGIVVMLVTRERLIPFGPFLALGTWAVMVRGREILDFWLGLFR
jgi:leader peptidase (prepilin peptidase)/N-methyltransferase